LIEDSFDNHVVSWSPDGRRLLYHASPSGSQILDEIWVMNGDGSGQLNLSDNPAPDFHPSWSPDGLRIAFSSQRDGDDEIYVVNADRSGLIALTDNASSDFHPDWSPNGQGIVFASDRDGSGEIYAMNADGTNIQRLTHNTREEFHPVWSPDSARIAFVSDDGLGHGEIWIMNSDGTGQRKVSGVVNSSSPFWSPDGRALVFDGYTNDLASPLQSDVYLADIANNTLAKLTNGPDESASGPWSPDGSTLLIRVGKILGSAKYYAVRPHGSGLRRLASETNFEEECCASWQPSPP
jgi:Tol biopolymer transport system component